MPKFKYAARDKDRKLVHGIVEYIDKDEVITALQSKGFIVLSVAPIKKRSKVKIATKKLRMGLRLEDSALFCRQMATLLNAGVTLLRSLTILLREVDSRPLYNAIERIRIDVEEGRTLHDAMAKHPKVFHALWISLVEAGEMSGQLASSFDNLAIYLEGICSVTRKVKSALVYPVILIMVCVAAILIFTLRIIPMFGQIYKDFKLELPGLTLAVINFSNFMQKYIIIITIFCAALFFLLKALVDNTRTGRLIFDTIKLKMPLLGPLIHSIILERFAHGLSVLIKSGIPILSGLDLIGKACGNKLFENAMELVKEDVRSGKPISGPLEESGLFPVMVTQMVTVGEETGKLSELLDRVAVYYQERMNTMVDRMTAAFEPLLLVFLGITVGVLVVAMYLPIFKIATGGIAY